MSNDQNGLFSLKGKCFVVTGGNGGLGLGMAFGLAGAGANIVIAARNAEKGKHAVAAINALGSRAFFVETNVGDRASCDLMATQAVAEFGRIDGLIANAGIALGGRPETLPVDRWREALAVNLDGILFSAQAVFPHLVKGGGGKIVVTGSMFSVFGCPHAIEYGASKGAAVQVAKSLAAAWARQNIQVNAILPGYLETDIIADAKRDDRIFDQSVSARTPLGRWGKPDDLAGIAVFLCSKASDFVTGAVIPVDGGYSITADQPSGYEDREPHR